MEVRRTEGGGGWISMDASIRYGHYINMGKEGFKFASIN